MRRRPFAVSYRILSREIINFFPIEPTASHHGHRLYSKCQKFFPNYPENPLFINKIASLVLLRRSAVESSLSCEFCERNCISFSGCEQGGDSELTLSSQVVPVAFGHLSYEAVSAEEPNLSSHRC